MLDKNRDIILKKVSSYLKKKHLTIATAESCTGGLIAHTLTNVSGSSEYFDRGVVSYSNKAKMELLGVSEKTLYQYGAVSEQTARAMAKGLREHSKVDMVIATTGIAGPTGGTKEKPVGLVYIAIATSASIVVKQFNFTRNRLQNKQSACMAALHMLLDYLSKE